MIISIIAAMAKNRVIGRSGAIPWHMPEDLRRFRELTMGHTIVMGRKTFENIGRPLPGRLNVILTRQPDYRAPGCRVCHFLAEALTAGAGAEEIFICGGGEIYRESMALADRIYLTVIDREYDGDTFFPDIPEGFVEMLRDETSGPCVFIFYQRKKD